MITKILQAMLLAIAVAAVGLHVSAFAGSDRFSQVLLLVPLAVLTNVALSIARGYSLRPGITALPPNVSDEFDYADVPRPLKVVANVVIAYGLVAFALLIFYLASHGWVKGDLYYYSIGQSRLATPAEVHRQDSWSAFGFSALIVALSIYPALSLFRGIGGPPRRS